MKTILLLVFLVCGINFFIDPLYTWQGNGKINLKRKDFDERIQKTNFLANINNNYDAILLVNILWCTILIPSTLLTSL